MNDFNGAGDGVGVGGGQDPVAEVEDVSGGVACGDGAGGFIFDAVDVCAQRVFAGEEEGGVEVALEDFGL